MLCMADMAIAYIQSILESEKIKYTHSGVLASSIAIDKDFKKNIC